MMMSGIRKDFGTVGAEFIARHPTPRYLISPFFWNHIVIFLLISISSIGIRIMSKMQILEKEKLSVELLYLKAQINPHFLFNTLNTIYAMAIKQSDESTANAVVMLSDMMRFVITETHNEVVSLDKKLQYVQNYIELQKLRLGENMVLDYEVKGDPLGKKIAPMILMPFIENAFKHGTTKEKNFAISIKILITEKELWLEVENSKFTGHKIEEETKLGIDNTRKRLELLYSSKHKFEIIENDHNYRISLKLIIV
jgi:LytS/YehU family sensor histidine kinase